MNGKMIALLIDMEIWITTKSDAFRHSYTGPHRHDPSNPRATGTVCPHYLSWYDTFLHLNEYSSSDGNEAEAVSIFTRQCRIRALQQVRQMIGDVKFKAASC
jgi:hypothetical protein